MQLSSLLDRLTADEHEIMLERREVPEPTRTNKQAIVTYLAHPSSVAVALSELNAAQFRLLQWLARRPDLQATWIELVKALGDRLPAELRDSYLQDMRLLALLDFHPTARGGFVATYPAAVAALPAESRQTLTQRLTAINSDVLVKVCGALGIRTPPTKKDQRIEAIVSTLTQPESCRAAVERLTEDARQLFSWIRERGGSVQAAEMHPRVRTPPRRLSRPAWTFEAAWDFVPKGQTLDPLSELIRCSLVVPISVHPSGWYAPTGFRIPDEIELAYSGRGFFDGTRMQVPALGRADGATGVVPNPANVLRDVGHLLGFISSGRCDWRQDGQPYKRSLVAFGKLIGAPDSEYVDLLWELIVAAQLVAPARGRAASDANPYQARAAGDFSPKELLGQLLLGWVGRGNITLGRGGSLFLRDNARLRLLLLTRSMPTDTWVLKRSLEEWLRFQWPLVFAPDSVGIQGTAPDPGWSALERMLLAHGATPDGQAATMLPEGHQRLLDAEAPDDSTSVPPWDQSWVVQPDRTVVAPPNLHPDAVVELWRVSALQSSQGASVFRLTADSVAAALNRGMTPGEVTALLTSRCRTPLPPTVERLIGDQAERYGRIKVGAAQTFVQTDDPALLDELRRSAKLKSLSWHDVAPGVAFVQGSNPNEVVVALRKAGYLPVLQQPESQAPGKGASAADATTRMSPPPARTIARLVKEAVRDGSLLTATWRDRGRTFTEELSPLDLHGDVLHAIREDEVEDVLIPFGQILELEIADDDDDLSLFPGVAIWDEEP